MPALAAAGMVGLSAVTATGAGPGFDVNVCQTFGLQVDLTGGPSVAKVYLQGTNDLPNIPDANATWFTLLTWDVTTPQSSGDILFIANKPVQRIRSNCNALSGGTAPTLTAKMSAV